MICTLVKTPRLGGQWCGSPDVVMMFARVRRLSVVSVQAISGAGSIEYFIFVHTYYRYTTGLVFLFFRGNNSTGSAAVFSQQLNEFLGV